MRVGVCGNGMIVRQALSCFAKAEIPVTALWCRNPDHGQPVADAFHISSVYTDYDAFLKDGSFDTVYIGLANSAHDAFAKKAMLAGKNVIVEKPFCATYAQAQELVQIAQETGAWLFEAIMSRYSANYEELIPWLDKLGDLTLIRCNFSQYSSRYDRYVNHDVAPAFDPALAGGALYDLNVYNVHFVAGLFGAPRFSYYMANKGWNGIDTSGVLLMDYGQFKAVCTAAKDSASDSGIVMQGTDGTIVIDDRPGYIDNVTFTDRKTKAVTRIDTHEEPDKMVTEFVRMQEVMDHNERSQMEIWLQRSLQVMAVLDNGRQDAGIVFPCDEETEETQEQTQEMPDIMKHFHVGGF